MNIPKIARSMAKIFVAKKLGKFLRNKYLLRMVEIAKMIEFFTFIEQF